MTDEAPEESIPNTGGDAVEPVEEVLPENVDIPNDDEFFVDNGGDAVSEPVSEDNDEDDIMKNFPPAVVKRVEKLQDLNTEQEAILEKYLEERAALEQKFRSLCQPLYQQRAKIIAGETDDEIAADSPAEAADDGSPKGIPQFWVCAIGHNETISDLLTEEDVDCLEYLSDIRCNEYSDGKGFVLEFHFQPENPYFSNSVLTKRYDVPNMLLADEPLLKNVEGCTIDWKSQEKCLTYAIVTKKQRGRGKHAGQVRTIQRKEHKESFFHFFDPPKLPTSMDRFDEEDAERLEEAFDADYDVANAFRLNLCPKAVLWFTGTAMDEIVEELEEAMLDQNGET
mmetsp:Transcript_435/g.624  ORF Transcript_435/g.624 Transcript_435/m.624 type:complete len:339 (-) Transcript_435:1600-2616(-)|eukprot:CAMPEP_0194226826 /NCGR_PEP_ID=MMETSP0156-20130528/42537_1 /TAXON_ID=33649 /ORGANISM="Thalassionema nitzschioides, Strain L26-B" /LENGTH=338 /DNA_ID=CAMNT_0038959287 /DNA_START=70 /DNA_END=1086 /DNA_ORIENTATION=+